MAPRTRLVALAREFACRAAHCFLRARLFLGSEKKKSRVLSMSEQRDVRLHNLQSENARLQYKTHIEKQMNKQDLNICSIENDLDRLDSKVEREVEQYKSKLAIHQEKLKVAMDGVRFSFINGAVAVFGVAVAGFAVICGVANRIPHIKGFLVPKMYQRVMQGVLRRQIKRIRQG